MRHISGKHSCLHSSSPKEISRPGSGHLKHGTPPAKRKVSFLTERSSETSLSSNGISPGPEVAAVLERYLIAINRDLFDTFSFSSIKFYICVAFIHHNKNIGTVIPN